MSADSDDETARSLLSLLGDEYVQEILVATSEGAKSARALSDELDAARSTIYRRTEDMLEHDLLIERTEIEADGSHHSIYEANVDHLDVDLDEGEFAVSVETRETPADRFTTMWTDIREA
ncbi:MAG: transcriptional regulator [Halobacteriaceae archaeon]